MRRLLDPAEVAAAAGVAVRTTSIRADRRGDPGRRRAHAVAAVPVPVGWRLRPSRGLRRERGGEVLLGGSPPRLIALSGRGAELVERWWTGEPVGDDLAERLLARRLLDAGLAHPDPPPSDRRPAEEVTIVVPVYGDAERLALCLAPLAGETPVIVVDDGSPDGGAIAAVADRFGARYVRHLRNRGAAAARNTGLELAATPIVAFLDADCVPPAGFPGELLDHLADPAVGLVAPRIVSLGGQSGRIAAYERCHSALDMGPQPSRVRPYSWVWYVPSAAMVARRTALGRGFDEDLELGEDVDLVWRLHDAGWQVRYDPRTRVAHHDRLDPVAWYRRRVAYNESVAPLLGRHPDRVPALFVSPPAAVGWAAWLSGWWPVLAGLTASARAAAVPVGVRAVTARRAMGGPGRRRVDGSGGARPRAGRGGPVGAVRARSGVRIARSRARPEAGGAARARDRRRLARRRPLARSAQLRSAPPRR